MPTANWFDSNCFPNPFFAPHDVVIEDESVTINLSHDAPLPVPSDSYSTSDEDSDDDELPPLVTPEPSDDGESDDEADDAVAPLDFGPDLPYSVANVCALVIYLFNDEGVSTNFQTMFGGAGRHFEYPAIEHWYERLDTGAYALRPHIAQWVMTHLRNLAGIIAAALNSNIVTDRGFEPGATNVSIPLTATDECGIAFPSIVVLLSGRWEIRYRDYPSEPEIRKHIEDILFVIRFNVAVVGKITTSALRLMEHSVCNPGAGIGMDQEEFLERVRVQPRITHQIKAWFDPLVHGGSSIRAADTACGRLLCPRGVSEFVIFENGDDASIFPLRHLEQDGMTSRSCITIEELPQILFARGFGH
ncbi:hypothetical protein K438DRAFT_2014717 [Mycena galopus ATCC 62051]|nr:hypothetical protein K438DRAFT_2014717 [Mycena galopus ATCC 62051]